MRETRLSGSMWRGPETERWRTLPGHEAGNGGDRQGSPTRHRAGPRPDQQVLPRGSPPSCRRPEVGMFGGIELGIEFFEVLVAIDAAILERAAAERCRDCGGPLHRGDYPRKPRGGLWSPAAGAFDRRFSLCCGREGCRHRATPPSVRFLGGRVYVGAVVIVASVLALAARSAGAAQRATGIAARTTRRWLRWWRGPFTTSAPFVELSARLVPSVARGTLPSSILERLPGESALRVRQLLAWLAPITGSSPARSRLLRGLA